MGKPVVRRPVDRSSYELLSTQAPRTENQIMPAVLKKKKKPGSRLWMRFDAAGRSEVLECDRNAILQRVSIPARDLRILGPVFSQSSHILARESAMVVNLEFVKTIITAEELYILEPTSPAVLPFLDQLRQQFPLQSTLTIEGGEPMVDEEGGLSMMAEGFSEVLPFEFQVLEVALDAVCRYLESEVKKLSQIVTPALDTLTKKISNSNLELVRSVKGQLTGLTARVQKVRNELEQLLDDDEDMANLYLTRKLQQLQHPDSPIVTNSSEEVNSLTSQKLMRLSSRGHHHHHHRAVSITTHTTVDGDVEELEMLLETYFMQVDASFNKLSMVREYISDTEDYINIQLDHHRNQLFQFQITLTTFALSIGLGMGFCGAVSMNIPIPPYNSHKWFTPFVCSNLFICTFVFFGIIGYVRWKGLFEK